MIHRCAQCGSPSVAIDDGLPACADCIAEAEWWRDVCRTYAEQRAEERRELQAAERELRECGEVPLSREEIDDIVARVMGRGAAQTSGGDR